MPELTDKSKAIWGTLVENTRAQSGTTIAVAQWADKTLLCSANDVSGIPAEATQEAIKQGIAKYSNSYVNLASAGFHAEMWIVMLAKARFPQNKVSEVILKVGASRPCCKNCSAILKHLNVEMESQDDQEYKSWYNPLTMNEYCNPIDNFDQFQFKSIPDFRNHGKDYWFKPEDKISRPHNIGYQNTPPDSAK